MTSNISIQLQVCNCTFSCFGSAVDLTKIGLAHILYFAYFMVDYIFMAVINNISIENMLLFGFKRKCCLVEQTEILIKMFARLQCGLKPKEVSQLAQLFRHFLN